MSFKDYNDIKDMEKEDEDDDYQEDESMEFQLDYHTTGGTDHKPAVVIGDYILSHKLGEGTRAEVFLAYDIHAEDAADMHMKAIKVSKLLYNTVSCTLIIRLLPKTSIVCRYVEEVNCVK